MSMQLLHCSPIPTAEFASLSLLLKNEKQGSILTVAGPLATLPLSTVSCCIHKLQEYVNSISKSSSSNATNSPSNTETTTIDAQFQSDDASLVDNDAVNVFRSSHSHGVALHYTIIKEKGLVQKCASILLQDGKGGALKVSVEPVSGILLAVGISGLSYAHSSSTLVATMSTRMRDFKTILHGLESFADLAECQSSIMATMETLLVVDDEERKTNAMVDLEAVTLMSDLDDAPPPIEKLKSPIGAVRKSAKKGRRSMSSLKGDSMMGGGASDLKLVVTATSSADLARITAENVAILSVSEKESQLRKYEATGLQRRSSMASALGKTKAVRARRRKAGNEADLEGFDCPSISPSKQQQSPLPALRPPGVDTASQINSSPNANHRPPRLSPKKSALPTLLAPRNDVANHRRPGQQASRRWSMGTSSNGPPRGPPPLSSAASDISTPGQAAFNAFAVESAVNDSFANGSFPNQQFAGVSEKQEATIPNGTANHAAATGRDPWGMIPSAATTEFNNAISPRNLVGNEEQQRPRYDFASPSDEQESALSPNSQGAVLAYESPRNRDEAIDSLQRMLLAAERSEMNGLKDDDDTSRGSRSVVSFQNGEWLQGMDEELRSAHSELDELVAKVTPAETNGNGNIEEIRQRLMINVALNEDLTCSYRQSKMSSCSIEGVVQVQVTCDSRDGVPFFLLVRDPSRHIRIVQENKRFADSMSEELRLSDNPDDVGIDHKYTVSVPSADDYFPVLRYKCSSELRPVPIVSFST